MYVEAALWSLIVLLLGVHAGLVSAGLLMFSCALFVLYSYNFLAPGRRKEGRMKAFWWGNFLTVFLGYLSLWLVGFSVAGVEFTSPSGWAWIALGAAFSLSDYAVFLNECALDDEDEIFVLPNTLPAMLGKRGVSRLALGVWALAALCCAALWRADELQGHRSGLIGLSLVVGAAGMLDAAFVFAPPVRSRGRGRRLRERAIDAYFSVARLVLMALVIYRNGHGNA
ncbi:hypothetical protein [Sorangium sp. So ce887]|uniref:hypothetical protein n=1 Tax=Sorangium sp. So ce887 TaxID=3133324 RepID=UPI003F616DE0